MVDKSVLKLDLKNCNNLIALQKHFNTFISSVHANHNLNEKIKNISPMLYDFLKFGSFEWKNISLIDWKVVDSIIQLYFKLIYCKDDSRANIVDFIRQSLNISYNICKAKLNDKNMQNTVGTTTRQVDNSDVLLEIFDGFCNAFNEKYENLIDQFTMDGKTITIPENDNDFDNMSEFMCNKVEILLQIGIDGKFKIADIVALINVVSTSVNNHIKNKNMMDMYSNPEQDTTLTDKSNQMSGLSNLFKAMAHQFKKILLPKTLSHQDFGKKVLFPLIFAQIEKMQCSDILSLLLEINNSGFDVLGLINMCFAYELNMSNVTNFMYASNSYFFPVSETHVINEFNKKNGPQFLYKLYDSDSTLSDKITKIEDQTQIESIFSSLESNVTYIFSNSDKKPNLSIDWGYQIEYKHNPNHNTTKMNDIVINDNLNDNLNDNFNDIKTVEGNSRQFSNSIGRSIIKRKRGTEQYSDDIGLYVSYSAYTAELLSILIQMNAIDSPIPVFKAIFENLLKYPFESAYRVVWLYEIGKGRSYVIKCFFFLLGLIMATVLFPIITLMYGFLGDCIIFSHKLGYYKSEHSTYLYLLYRMYVAFSIVKTLSPHLNLSLVYKCAIYGLQTVLLLNFDQVSSLQ